MGPMAATVDRDFPNILALGNMQASTHPELETVLRSIQVNGSGTTVAVSFELSAETLDLLARRPGLQPGR